MLSWFERQMGMLNRETHFLHPRGENEILDERRWVKRP